MGPVTAIKTCIRKFRTFSGRAPRSEFWWSLALGIIPIAFFVGIATLIDNRMIENGSRISGEFHPLIWLALTLSLLPILASGFRRLHDAGLPGWLILVPPTIFGVAFFGSFLISGFPVGPNYNAYASWPFAMTMIGVTLISLGALLTALVLPSTPSTNKYGPNPHEVTP